MSSNFRITHTAKTWATSVVPVFGGAFGYVCPDAAVRNGSAMRPSAIDGFAALAQGPQTWSPPVT